MQFMAQAGRSPQRTFWCLRCGSISVSQAHKGYIPCFSNKPGKQKVNLSDCHKIIRTAKV